MKYWYLKNGDLVGPMSVEEIAKDAFFAEDSLVCPEDKAEQSDFWKPAQEYAKDFACVFNKEEEMFAPQEVFLDDINLEDEVNNEEEQTPAQAKPEAKPETKPETQESATAQEPKQDQQREEEKNPFETDRPQIAPNIEDTLSSHAVAPRLDAEGDTLLEDIPAKAILASEDEEGDSKESSAELFNDFIKQEDTLEDTPIVNIFEQSSSTQRNKTREITDISENIYNAYGSDSSAKQNLEMKGTDKEQQSLPPQAKKNNKIYLLLIVMFILIMVALLLALFGSESDAEQLKPQTSLPKTSANILQDSPMDEEEIDTPTTDAAAFLSSSRVNLSDQEKALAKVKRYILPTGQNIETYLGNKYAAYQTSWVATVLSGKNYCVHFNANKVRQEPVVYSFSIDLDKNEINGLNNLGMDLLVKGE